VICGDTLSQRKPHPAPVLLACELAGVAPGCAIMVGDDPRDLDAGEAAGTLTALAAYGYGAVEVMDSGRVLQYVLDAPSDLLSLFDTDLRTPNESVTSR
jgi:phosphoglycolate phosphatase-like HAD superfamily hydrolase